VASDVWVRSDLLPVWNLFEALPQAEPVSADSFRERQCQDVTLPGSSSSSSNVRTLWWLRNEESGSVLVGSCCAHEAQFSR